MLNMLAKIFTVLKEIMFLINVWSRGFNPVKPK